MALKKRGFNFLGLNVWTQKSFNGFTQEIEKKLTDSKYGNRPWSEFYGSYGGDVVRIPYWPLDLKTVYDIAYFSDTLSTSALLSIRWGSACGEGVRSYDGGGGAGFQQPGNGHA